MTDIANLRSKEAVLVDDPDKTTTSAKANGQNRDAYIRRFKDRLPSPAVDMDLDKDDASKATSHGDPKGVGNIQLVPVEELPLEDSRAHAHQNPNGFVRNDSTTASSSRFSEQDYDPEDDMYDSHTTQSMHESGDSTQVPSKFSRFLEKGYQNKCLEQAASLVASEEPYVDRLQQFRLQDVDRDNEFMVRTHNVPFLDAADISKRLYEEIKDLRIANRDLRLENTRLASTISTPYTVQNVEKTEQSLDEMQQKLAAADVRAQAAERSLWKSRVAMSKSPFVTVLVDGSSYPFSERRLFNGHAGGMQLANDLLGNLKAYVASVEEGNDWDVIVRMYVDLGGLASTTIDTNYIKAFAHGFTQKYSFFDLIDIGEEQRVLKSKISGKFDDDIALSVVLNLPLRLVSPCR